jgi:hypothetical protein
MDSQQEGSDDVTIEEEKNLWQTPFQPMKLG